MRSLSLSAYVCLLLIFKVIVFLISYSLVFSLIPCRKLKWFFGSHVKTFSLCRITDVEVFRIIDNVPPIATAEMDRGYVVYATRCCRVNVAYSRAAPRAFII